MIDEYDALWMTVKSIFIHNKAIMLIKWLKYFLVNMFLNIFKLFNFFRNTK